MNEFPPTELAFLSLALVEKFNLDVNREECQQLLVKYDLKNSGRFAYCDFVQSCVLLLKAQETSVMRRMKIQNAHKMVRKPPLETRGPGSEGSLPFFLIHHKFRSSCFIQVVDTADTGSRRAAGRCRPTCQMSLASLPPPRGPPLRFPPHTCDIHVYHMCAIDACTRDVYVCHVHAMCVYSHNMCHTCMILIFACTRGICVLHACAMCVYALCIVALV